MSVSAADSGTARQKPDITAPDQFSLVAGGALFNLLIRLRMLGPPQEFLYRRLIALTALAWVPLLVCSIAAGTLAPGATPVSFLRDIATQARFLIALPLLLVAEAVAHDIFGFVLAAFRDRELVPTENRSRFSESMTSAMRLRNSVAIEVALAVLVLLIGRATSLRLLAPDSSTWYASIGAQGMELTPGGWWYACVSLPLFQFLLLRWYFRLFVWARLCWQISRLDLRLLPAHPDGMGGLGFLARSAIAFAPVLCAHGVLLSGLLANRIIHSHARLTDFRFDIAAAVVLLLFLFLSPLLMFAPALRAAKLRGRREYGVLASRYVNEFDRKWLGTTRPDEKLVGSADIQSLADLAGSYEIVGKMRTLPIGRDTVLILTAALVIPMLPLMLTMFSLAEIIKRVVEILI